jgi:hypothetical protein
MASKRVDTSKADTSKADTSKADNLKQDPVLSGQNYAVVSFVNPKDKVLEKNLYYLNQFLIKEINNSLTAQATQMAKKLIVEMNTKINDTLDKLKSSVDEEDKHIYKILNDRYRSMSLDEDEYVEECRRQYSLEGEEILDKYKIFLSENRTKLDHTFDEANDHACSLRGFKVRGSYARFEDARDRAQFLRDSVEPLVHAFVVQVGTWFPVDMEADEVQDQDYMLPKLNELMGKYHEGMQARDKFFHERNQELMTNPTPTRGNVKERLKKKLQERQNEKINKEISEFKQLSGSGSGSGN